MSHAAVFGRARGADRHPRSTHARVFLSGPGTHAQDAGPSMRCWLPGVANQKVDMVMIRVDDNLGTTPKMSPEVYRAVIEEAHKRGRRVATHSRSRRREGAARSEDPTSSRTASATPTSMRTFVAEAPAPKVCCASDPHARSVDLRLRVDAARSSRLGVSQVRESRVDGGGLDKPEAQPAIARARRRRGARRAACREADLKTPLGCRRADRDGHRHWSAGAIPGLLRADGARAMVSAGLTPRHAPPRATPPAA